MFNFNQIISLELAQAWFNEVCISNIQLIQTTVKYLCYIFAASPGKMMTVFVVTIKLFLNISSHIIFR